MSAGSFNLDFNLSKCLTQDAKDLLKARTSDADHEFCTTDAMKTVIHVTKIFSKINPPLQISMKSIPSIVCIDSTFPLGRRKCQALHSTPPHPT